MREHRTFDCEIFRCSRVLINNNNNNVKFTDSASELYLPSHLRLSAKLVPNFADRGVSRGHRG
jgi:hypothetical protein